jgi:aryl-alcohol dehydrogenase-like predicted oxidoreductase
VPTARELGVGIVAYSPLGRGFLSASFSKLSDLDAKDWRRSQPRFSADAFDSNVAALQPFFDMAAAKGCTPAQLALAWVHRQGADVFPIPGTKSVRRIEENAVAVAVADTITDSELAVLSELRPPVGDRYNESGMKATFAGRL